MTTLNLFHPRGTYDQKHSNIDVLALSVAKGWHFGNGAEVHIEGTFLQANGEPYESYWGWENRSRENWTGGALGFVLRMNYIDDERARAFVDVHASYLITNYALPWGGSPENAFLLAGPGLSLRISPEYRADFGVRWAHVSNADTYDNPAWNGSGIFLTVSRRVNF